MAPSGLRAVMLYSVGILLLAVLALVSGDHGRAINSTGLWSKYNLIVRPELKNVLNPSTTASTVSTTTAALPPSPRWEEEEDYGQDLPLDDEGDRDESEEDDQDEEEDEEDEQVFVAHTTQRSKGDGGKKKRPSLHQPNKKTSKHTRKGYKGHKGVKGLKRLRKYMFPLLIAYKLKFFTLIPVLLGGLMLIVATTGFAGFFFALFAVGVGLKKD